MEADHGTKRERGDPAANPSDGQRNKNKYKGVSARRLGFTVEIKGWYCKGVDFNILVKGSEEEAVLVHDLARLCVNPHCEINWKRLNIETLVETLEEDPALVKVGKDFLVDFVSTSLKPLKPVGACLKEQADWMKQRIVALAPGAFADWKKEIREKSSNAGCRRDELDQILPPVHENGNENGNENENDLLELDKEKQLSEAQNAFLEIQRLKDRVASLEVTRKANEDKIASLEVTNKENEGKIASLEEGLRQGFIRNYMLLSNLINIYWSPSPTSDLKEIYPNIEVEELKAELEDLKAELEYVKKAFTPLPVEAEKAVQDALFNSCRSNLPVLKKGTEIQVTRADLQCLKPGAWLNGEVSHFSEHLESLNCIYSFFMGRPNLIQVINAFLKLLKEREKRNPEKFLKCHFFDTFFYNKLYKDKRSYDYKSVRRWTKLEKISYSLADCDKIMVPIHRDNHWCLAVIHLRDQKIEYMNSLKGRDENVLKVLAMYLVDEAKDKNDRD